MSATAFKFAIAYSKSKNMRHRNSGRQLSRNASHRHAMLRNMATSLLQHETIRTTVPKAKELRRVVEPLITLAKVDSIGLRRLAYSRLRDDTVVEKLFEDLGPRFKARAGGYTRILKMEPRPGDSADMALMQLVDSAAGRDRQEGRQEGCQGAEGREPKKTKAKKAAAAEERAPRRSRSRSGARKSRRCKPSLMQRPRLARQATRANASRVIFSGLPAVVATLSSMRIPP